LICIANDKRINIFPLTKMMIICEQEEYINEFHDFFQSIIEKPFSFKYLVIGLIFANDSFNN
jgi:hypothetical protein